MLFYSTTILHDKFKTITCIVSTLLVFGYSLNLKAQHTVDSTLSKTGKLSETKKFLTKEGAEAVLVKRSIPSELIEVTNLYYDDSLGRYFWTVFVNTVPFDKYTNKEMFDRYNIDASTGEIALVLRNIEMDYSHWNHWFWGALHPLPQRFPEGTRLDSVIILDRIRKVIIINHNDSVVLGKKQKKYLVNNLKRSVFTGGYYSEPHEFQLLLISKNNPDTISQIFTMHSNTIRFNPGIDKQGNGFLASFHMPAGFNMEYLIPEKLKVKR